MYFKKLELLGFKSFCEKTTLHFEPGITAVVGPNGCGKSNVMDSIRWVLGEQSAKSLRGSEMLDVIFNGTDLKEPLGMAEVTLTFDNGSGFLNIDHPEVAITRRIFRSGESEYLLNKAPVRLKDILDLLMGTGIGAESYSIVAQGKIDLVLSSRPEDRRLVFDEASGITKYKAQKRETMRKLEETEQNLLRVNDIITEVKRQIGSLERQANKARKYKEAFEELKEKEIKLAVLERQSLTQQKEQINLNLAELEANSEDLLNGIKDQELKTSQRQIELRQQEESMLSVRNQILNLENVITLSSEHITFNQERLQALASQEEYLKIQIQQTNNRLALDEEKLSKIKTEYLGLNKNIEDKTALLDVKESQLNNVASLIKGALDLIANSKKGILGLAANIANTRNDIADFKSKEQIFLSRKKRLEIEKAKAYEEEVITKGNLSGIEQEVLGITQAVSGLNTKISSVKADIEQEGLSLNNIANSIIELEKERLALESHREFLETLKTKYDDIGESMNAVILLDKPPVDNVSGFVIKVANSAILTPEEQQSFKEAGLKFMGEAKPIELDTGKINEKINKLHEGLQVLKSNKTAKEFALQALNSTVNNLQQELRTQEIAFSTKETSRLTILEQFNKIKDEEEIIVIELSDIQKEISVLEQNIGIVEARLLEFNNKQTELEDLILQQEASISVNGKLREEMLIFIAQTKTELAALNKRLVSDEVSLKMMEDTYRNDKEALLNIETQIKEIKTKQASMEQEVKDCQLKITQSQSDKQTQQESLITIEAKYKEISEETSVVSNAIEEKRREFDLVKDKIYELQMQAKDVEYKHTTLKTQMLQGYKIDLDSTILDTQGFDHEAIGQEVAKLKERLESYGAVNLVAIEEYDELKKRYDFLIQQQTDLFTAKDALHQAILKINRTTKQMFMETFEKVRVEFRNYFRALFNGGDAQVFLIDEQDPLESGIEIICRPPGKKLQNVLLLSGGEKSMSAIALIFAIFKVKPSPFCILDEIDAALDEANVDRFSRILQEFSENSQFIVITHNKKTIANANVMYGITMEQSGVSKIVSVKFAKNHVEKEPETALPEPA